MKKYKNVTYIMKSNVKAELITWLSAYIKISLTVLLKQPLWKTFTVHSCIPFHECLSGGGLGFRSWRGWLVIWGWKWLGSSTKLPGGLDFHLMKRKAPGEEWTWCCPRFWVWKEHSHIFMKDSLGNNTLEANQSCDKMQWSPWLWRT